MNSLGLSANENEFLSSSIIQNNGNKDNNKNNNQNARKNDNNNNDNNNNNDKNKNNNKNNNNDDKNNNKNKNNENKKTNVPTPVPTEISSTHPSQAPTIVASNVPSLIPTDHPTLLPSVPPTIFPSVAPSEHPTHLPSDIPTINPTVSPTLLPTLLPSSSPTIFPTLPPTITGSNWPTSFPSSSPSSYPTTTPTEPPTWHPTTSHPTTSHPTMMDPNTFVTLSASIVSEMQFVPSQMTHHQQQLYKQDVKLFLTRLFQRPNSDIYTPNIKKLDVLIGAQILIPNQLHASNNHPDDDDNNKNRQLQFVKPELYRLQTEILVTGQYIPDNSNSDSKSKQKNQNNQNNFNSNDMKAYVEYFFLKHGHVLRDFMLEGQLEYFSNLDSITTLSSMSLEDLELYVQNQPMNNKNNNANANSNVNSQMSNALPPNFFQSNAFRIVITVVCGTLALLLMSVLFVWVRHKSRKSAKKQLQINQSQPPTFIGGSDTHTYYSGGNGDGSGSGGIPNHRDDSSSYSRSQQQQKLRQLHQQQSVEEGDHFSLPSLTVEPMIPPSNHLPVSSPSRYASSHRLVPPPSIYPEHDHHIHNHIHIHNNSKHGRSVSETGSLYSQEEDHPHHRPHSHSLHQSSHETNIPPIPKTRRSRRGFDAATTKIPASSSSISSSSSRSLSSQNNNYANTNTKDTASDSGSVYSATGINIQASMHSSTSSQQSHDHSHNKAQYQTKQSRPGPSQSLPPRTISSHRFKDPHNNNNNHHRPSHRSRTRPPTIMEGTQTVVSSNSSRSSSLSSFPQRTISTSSHEFNNDIDTHNDDDDVSSVTSLRSNHSIASLSLASTIDTVALQQHYPYTKYCRVPPGASIGLALRTSQIGPMVTQIHPNSPLSHQMGPGDIIVSMDELDTRGMPAEVMVKLVKNRQHQDRTFTVISKWKALMR